MTDARLLRSWREDRDALGALIATELARLLGEDPDETYLALGKLIAVPVLEDGRFGRLGGAGR
jgi:hypothetical protein